jgi:muconolactone delta-isomerase
MEYLTDLVTMVPEGTSPVKVDELRAAEAVRAAELAKAGHLVRLSGARRSVQANGAALGCSAPPMRQSFAKSSPRYPFISG